MFVDRADCEAALSAACLRRPHTGQLTRSRVPADIVYGARKMRRDEPHCRHISEAVHFRAGSADDRDAHSSTSGLCSSERRNVNARARLSAPADFAMVDRPNSVPTGWKEAARCASNSRVLP